MYIVGLQSFMITLLLTGFVSSSLPKGKVVDEKPVAAAPHVARVLGPEEKDSPPVRGPPVRGAQRPVQRVIQQANDIDMETIIKVVIVTEVIEVDDQVTAAPKPPSKPKPTVVAKTSAAKVVPTKKVEAKTTVAKKENDKPTAKTVPSKTTPEKSVASKTSAPSKTTPSRTTNAKRPTKTSAKKNKNDDDDDDEDGKRTKTTLPKRVVNKGSRPTGNRQKKNRRRFNLNEYYKNNKSAKTSFAANNADLSKNSAAAIIDNGATPSLPSFPLFGFLLITIPLFGALFL